jgi:cold shock CspA family protein
MDAELLDRLNNDGRRLSGTVVYVNSARGFGFIRPRDVAGRNQDVYFHYSQRIAGEPVRVDDAVSYILGPGPDGRINALAVKSEQ